MSAYIKVELDDDGGTKVSVKGTDVEIINMLTDFICAFSAKSMNELKAKEVVKLIDDSLEEWE